MSARAGDACLGALLLVGLWALGVVSERWSLVALAGAAVVAGAAWPLERRALERVMPLLYLALPFALLARFWPVEVRGIDLSLGYYQALYLTAVGALLLAGPRGPGRVARVLLASGLSLAAAGTDIAHATYRPMVIAWAALALVASRLERPLLAAPAGPRLRPATLALALLVSVSTVGGVRWLDGAYEDLNRAFYRFMRARPPSPGGFSGKADLGSVADLQGRQGDTVALRAFGPRAPGYLRARVFITYAGGSWSAADAEHPEPVRREAEDGRYPLAGRRDVVGSPTWRLHPGPRYRQHVFLPLEAATLAQGPASLEVWPGETFVRHDGGGAEGYAAHAEGAPAAWFHDAEAPGWRALPDDPALLAALDEVLAGLGLAGPCATPDAARAAVRTLQGHFAARYTYHVGITFDPGRDPVEQFLREKDRGHCELFAASGALLLRRLGVAARYTTGFVCEEKNAWGDQWIARNKHAHAWLEVLDPDLGWQTVELTPPSAVPAAQPPGGAESLLDALAGLWEQVKAAALNLDVQALLALVVGGVAQGVAWLVGAWWRVALLLGLAAALALRAWRRRVRARGPVRRLAPDLERDRARLRRLERALARHGLRRDPAETLLEWAARLEKAPEPVPDRAGAAAFVRGYAARRYAPGASA
ncbi:MAG: transglutaminase-like domain-containing protein [Planctomycetes bacterium]|nr:transglutaminase-like domain-containing protein [Planctomycetota bacterium]